MKPPTNSLTPADYATPEQMARNHARLKTLPDRSAPFTWADERAADRAQAELDEMLEQAEAQHAAGRNLPLFCL
jgi:hypothetical protein